MNEIRKNMEREEISYQKKKNRNLIRLANDARASVVNWGEVIEDIVAETGYTKTDLSMALGLSFTWASSIVNRGIKKMDYPVGAALKKMHKRLCDKDLHDMRFGDKDDE
jgi:hypothetical protein